MSDKVKHPVFWTVFLSIVSLAWVYPIVLVLINSFKQKAYISRNAFSLPTGKAFVGLENYIRGIERTNLISSFGWTVVITVGAVLLIIVCTSMCAWWIVRVHPVRTRGVCDDRRRVGTENLLPNRTAYHAPEPDFSGDPADDVDLE